MAGIYKPDRHFYADQIGKALGKTVEGFIEAGEWLIEAKRGPDKLPHGEFLAMVADDLKISADTAQRLMKIAGHPVLSNAAYARLLPPTRETLYELTKVEDDKLEAAIKDGRVNPMMERKDAAGLLPTKTPKPTKPPAATAVATKAPVIVVAAADRAEARARQIEKPRQSDVIISQCLSDIEARIGAAFKQLTPSDASKLAAELDSLIDGLNLLANNLRAQAQQREAVAPPTHPAPAAPEPLPAHGDDGLDIPAFLRRSAAAEFLKRTTADG